MPPEVKLAQRLIQRRNLCPPVDVKRLLQEFAVVEYVDFPVQIDGLCLGLKAAGRKPSALVNKSSYPTRQRFTLAHELGHVLIPWHMGSIIDEIDVADFSNDGYLAVEAEANRFASELLMPTDWVKRQIRSVERPLEALFRVSSLAAVSPRAASIKLINCLPPNYVMASSVDDQVNWSSRSDGTLAAAVGFDTDLKVVDPYPFPCERWSQGYNGTTFHLWHFTAAADPPVE